MAFRTSLAVKLVVAGLLCLLMSTGVSNAEVADMEYEQVSSVLFPDTSGWTAVSGVKNADEKWLAGNTNKLKDAFQNSPLADGGDDCSFIDGIFSSEEGAADYFYEYDVDSDGMRDVIYTGPAICEEADATVIWFGAKGGYTIKQDAPWDVLLLRIKPGKQFQFSSVAVGCCDSIIDEYFVGDISNTSVGGDVSITSDTAMPSAAQKPARFSSGRDMALRASPEVDDAYDKSESEHMDSAVFGNVLSRYMPGCTGVVIGSDKDAAGNQWCFVRLDETCNPLRTHDPYEVNAGWVDAQDITVGAP